MENIPGWIIIAGPIVGAAILLVLVAALVTFLVLICLYCTKCVWCPCNRKRGTACLQYVGSRSGGTSGHGRSRVRSQRSITNVHFPKKENSEGVITIYRFNGTKMINTASPTPSTSVNWSSTSACIGEVHENTNVSESQSMDLSIPVDALSSQCESEVTSENDAEKLAETLTCALYNSMPNDGFKPSLSWGVQMQEPISIEEDSKLASSFLVNNVNSHESQSSAVSQSATNIKISQNLTRMSTEECLKKCGVIGCYLFRSTSNGLCLSVLTPDQKCRHLVVDRSHDNLYKIKSLPVGSESFTSLEKFVEFYTNNEVHFQDGGLSVKLSKHYDSLRCDDIYI